MSETEAIFSGKITERQFNEVQIALLPSWARWYFLAPCYVLVFMAIGNGWDTIIINPSKSIEDIAWGIAVFLGSTAIIKFGRKRGWKQYVLLHGSISGKVNNAGVEWNTETSRTSLEWEKILGYRTQKDLTLIFYAPRCAFFVPKEFLPSEQELRNLLNLLSSNSKKI